MDIKLQDVVGFSSFYKEVKSSQMPIKTAYTISKIWTLIKSDMEFYEEKFNAILIKYCETDDFGNFIPVEHGAGLKIKDGELEKCQKEISELLEVNVSKGLPKLTIEELEVLQTNPETLEKIINFFE